MAPVIVALRRAPWARVRLLASAQHRELLDQALSLFRMRPDVDLDVMRRGQTLCALSARLLTGLDRRLAQEAPDAVLAQGDTTTVLVAALACRYRRIPFGHVEAGLRTGDLARPFPEEMNRVVADRLARWHFAPTEAARRNLLREGVPAAGIHVTGNTIIDALRAVAARTLPRGLALDPHRRLILVTAHRRESFGAPLRGICRAVRALADRNPDVQVVYPVHPNPEVHAVVHRLLAAHPRILLREPLDYGVFLRLMQRAYLILTDSGGIQEEAPALGRPVLVLRPETERPEGVRQGGVRLVSTDFATITRETQRLLDDPRAYRAMARRRALYGDGRAAGRIVRVLRADLAGRRRVCPAS